MDTMKAAILYGKKDIRIEQVPMQLVGDNQVLIRIKAVGICGSDLHYYEHFGMGESYKLTEPQILGHEPSGQVVQVGKNVTGLAMGARVTIEPGEICFKCFQCKSGHYNLCPDVHFLSTPANKGAFAEYLVMDADMLFKIPDTMSYDIACMAEPLSVGINACKQAEAGPGKSLLILGAGPIGLLTLVAARAYGVTNLIICDIQDSRLVLAKKFGAKHVFNSAKVSSKEEIKRLTDGVGVDCCIETAGNPITHELTVSLTRKGGNIALVGIPKDTHVPINVFDIIDKELTIRGVFRYANTYRTAIEILESGIVNFEEMITNRFSLDETGKALELTLKDKMSAIKNLIVID